MAEALLEFAAMAESEREQMGERGRRWVYEHHGMTALAHSCLTALSRPSRGVA